MLSRNIRNVIKCSTIKVAKPVSIATYHQSSTLYKKATELKEVEDSPFDKLAQGINAIKSAILNAPPLRKLTRPNIESLPFTGHATDWEFS
jgi:hexaprenyl-diphosphate synthase